MKIRMKTRFCDGTRTIEPDREAELPDAQALDLIDKGFAVPADEAAEAKVAKARAARPRKAAAKTDPTTTDPGTPTGGTDPTSTPAGAKGAGE